LPELKDAREYDKYVTAVSGFMTSRDLEVAVVANTCLCILNYVYEHCGLSKMP
jgi:hypothetical protein